MPLVQERAKTLGEVPLLVDFFFGNELDYDAAMLQGKLDKEQARAILEKSIPALDCLGQWKTEDIETTVRGLTEELGMKAGPFFGVLRVAVTGRTASPPLFQTMEVLGHQRCNERLAVALAKLKA
jgi:glutamyl-tRNA synthetase